MSTCAGWPNGKNLRLLESKFELHQSQRKSSQVDASRRKSTQVGSQTKRKLNTIPKLASTCESVWPGLYCTKWDNFTQMFHCTERMIDRASLRHQSIELSHQNIEYMKFTSLTCSVEPAPAETWAQFLPAISGRMLCWLDTRFSCCTSNWAHKALRAGDRMCEPEFAWMKLR